jgi:hypothetical protein
MHRNSERGILEKRTPGNRIYGNKNFKKEYPEEERGGRTREEVISGGAFR